MSLSKTVLSCYIALIPIFSIYTVPVHGSDGVIARGVRSGSSHKLIHALIHALIPACSGALTWRAQAVIRSGTVQRQAGEGCCCPVFSLGRRRRRFVGRWQR
jgi:hypothetical protein